MQICIAFVWNALEFYMQNVVATHPFSVLIKVAIVLWLVTHAGRMQSRQQETKQACQRLLKGSLLYTSLAPVLWRTPVDFLSQNKIRAMGARSV